MEKDPSKMSGAEMEEVIAQRAPTVYAILQRLKQFNKRYRKDDPEADWGAALTEIEELNRELREALAEFMRHNPEGPTAAQ